MRQANLPLAEQKALPSVQLIHGDCLEVMPTLPPRSVQMVFADLPYCATDHLWDLPINLHTMWLQINRLCSVGCPSVFTAQQPFTTTLICSQKSQFRYDLTWNKNTFGNFANAKKMPLRAHETVLVFGKTATYNPQMRRTNGRTGIIRGSKNGKINNANGLVKKECILTNFRYPLSTLHFSRDQVRNGQGHPTQKPVALLEWIIRTYTNEGDTVLDPTAGSMTTAVAALRTGRNAICIEKEGKYFRIGKERVRAEQERLSQMG